MDAAGALMTIAQLAMSLTGFAGLLTAFRVSRAKWKRVEIYAVRFLLMSSIAAIVFALGPAPWLVAGTSSQPNWRVWHGLLGAWALIMVLWAFRERARGALIPRFEFGYWGLTLSGLGTAGLQALGAGGMLQDVGVPLYLYGLYWLLAVAIFQLVMQILAALQSVDVEEL